MTRRLEAGPLLVMLGALLLLVSLFLPWYTGDVTAWEAFEVWDVVLFALALASIAAGLGMSALELDLDGRRALPAAVGAVAVIVASQIIDPPPAAAGQDPSTGAWLALGSALVMCAGAVLTFGRVHLALTVEGRETERRHVAAVDARGPIEDTTETAAVKPRDGEPEARKPARLFARERSGNGTADTAAAGDKPGTERAAVTGDAPATKRPAHRRAGKQAPEPKQD
jgi:hypothetical protein